ncbi:MAG TPA: 16S rRNA (guanine(527)-N(7))-methyltransferase RsmG [Flavobacteriaceae bacterium]|nr:16S rRNA (guanine(527)-N(7))-methyltransferase RsmG [Flavobacteriaceae bacterium]MCB9213119.1 16S rRNA (guanine(527)-N(7))-methyltransferase RsmG [Alteromonas sp.]HPF11025.1 16S rRNA (guanine(527)-N(7))-methyltransferase RsmG [Flavobacteriaceae bacterium]HQU21876.1 16S rRNA (guanine(527)-N(7))-methyltransferase RsmG [Flavobacteriaceae bacterium]HQU64126.1 16S rRNA (guanine(527)-N(7))-methyltransferase RsmG [Flavobacteriaceae bacterium]
MEIILKYFPNLSEKQKAQFSALYQLYEEWNGKINVISRKDIDALYLKHVLHSLGIGKVQSFSSKARVLDVGTGGGFPGIPLAILFPETEFHLVDSIGKKIKVVEAVAAELQLLNVEASHARAESVEGTYDFIVSRAVTQMETFVGWVRDKVAKRQQHDLMNGILYLKGGDLTEELLSFKNTKIHPLSGYFEEPFFETKSVVYLPLKYRGKA